MITFFIKFQFEYNQLVHYSQEFFCPVNGHGNPLFCNIRDDCSCFGRGDPCFAQKSANHPFRAVTIFGRQRRQATCSTRSDGHVDAMPLRPFSANSPLLQSGCCGETAPVGSADRRLAQPRGTRGFAPQAKIFSYKIQAERREALAKGLNILISR